MKRGQRKEKSMVKVSKQKTLVLVKPDGVERGLVGEVIKRFENRGIKIVGIKMLKPSQRLVEQHYEESIALKYGKTIRDGLIKYIVDAPVVAMALEGVEVIKVVRKLTGETPYPIECSPGTIRGDFCHISKDYANTNSLTVRNVIHASSDEADAKRELKLWFKPDDFIVYKRADEIHIW